MSTDAKDVRHSLNKMSRITEDGSQSALMIKRPRKPCASPFPFWVRGGLGRRLCPTGITRYRKLSSMFRVR